MYCSVFQIPSVMVLSNLELEEHKSCAARDDKERSDCKRKKATKTCFLLPHSFHLQKTNSVAQAVLRWDGSCVTRPACNYSDDEIFHILSSCANNVNCNVEFPKPTLYVISYRSFTLQRAGCPVSSNSNKCD